MPTIRVVESWLISCGRFAKQTCMCGFKPEYSSTFKNMEEDSKKIIILDLIKNCFTELIDEYFEILLDGQSLCYYINLNISIFDENLLESYNLRFDSQNYYEELILYLNMQYN